jgi:hypothetical protein
MKVSRKNQAPDAVVRAGDRKADRSSGKKGAEIHTPMKGETRQSPDAFYRDAVKKPGIRRLMERLAKS